MCLRIARTDFECPHCEKQYDDIDNKYLNRCNDNKDFSTKINCDCGRAFKMTYNYQGNAVSFE